MNLLPLFKEQQKLRQVIVKNHNLQKHHLLNNFLVSIQCEIAELANEWRGFKHWSRDRQMRREKALEEFADCLAFLLELGLELDIVSDCVEVTDPTYKRSTTIQIQVLELNGHLYKLYKNQDKESWISVMELLLGLGEMLGFTDDEMINAYYEKLKINHKRQQDGY